MTGLTSTVLLRAVRLKKAVQDDKTLNVNRSVKWGGILFFHTFRE